jgi:hypothetical protein
LNPERQAAADEDEDDELELRLARLQHLLDRRCVRVKERERKRGERESWGGELRLARLHTHN